MKGKRMQILRLKLRIHCADCENSHESASVHRLVLCSCLLGTGGSRGAFWTLSGSDGVLVGRTVGGSCCSDVYFHSRRFRNCFCPLPSLSAQPPSIHLAQLGNRSR